MSDLTIKNILQKDIERKINEMFENTSKGFLYKETIYRVKKND